MSQNQGLHLAQHLDQLDDLKDYRSRFYLPSEKIYMDGNSLGLLSKDAEKTLLRVLDEWKSLGIEGWLGATPPWYTFMEEMAKHMALLVGAKTEEVILTASTTVNLHALVSTFFQPKGKRQKIVATALDFPSDIYALQGQVRLKGGNPEKDLMIVSSRDGRLMWEEDIIASLTDEVCLLVIPSVYYRSGQLLDIALLAKEAHQKGVLIAVDACHSAGAVPHYFDEWQVDFAFWCNYKYLNGGPGSVASLYVNEQHFGTLPALPGWWGSHKATQFDMELMFKSAGHAGAWQIGSPAMLSAAPLQGSLQIFSEVGIDRIRQNSLAKTDYLIRLLEERKLLTPDYGYQLVTPRDHAARGGHVALSHVEAARISKALIANGVIPDFRQPDIIRLAPTALYNTFEEIWQTVDILKNIIDQKSYESFSTGRELVA
jgi:kynureninase